MSPEELEQYRNDVYSAAAKEAGLTKAQAQTLIDELQTNAKNSRKEPRMVSTSVTEIKAGDTINPDKNDNVWTYDNGARTYRGEVLTYVQVDKVTPTAKTVKIEGRVDLADITGSKERGVRFVKVKKVVPKNSSMTLRKT